MSRPYLTLEAYKKLKEEFKFLTTEKRKEVIEALQEAKGLGDLSENAAYLEAKNAQIRLETRIREIEDLLRSASIIHKGSNNGRVNMGSCVTVVNLAKSHQEKIFHIVGFTEAQPLEGRISNESPLGRAFLGREEGDVILAKTPVGEVKYKILKIS